LNAYGLPETLGDRRGSDNEPRDFTVAGVQRHVEVALFLFGRHPRRGTGPLHVGDDQRRLAGRDQAEGLGHEIDPGPRRGGHGSSARPCATERHVDRRQFVFRLNDVTAVVFDAFRQILHDRRRGRDRIAGVEPAAGSDCTHADRLVAVE